MNTAPSESNISQLPGIPPAPRRGRKPGARKEGGQEAAIDLDKIKDVIGKRIDELVNLYKAHETAGEDLSTAVKKAAEDCGLNTKAVRSFVTARAGKKFGKARKNCEQLSLLFDEVGE